MPPSPANPSADPGSRMSAMELRAGLTLAAIFGLRMLGLFLVLPVFAVYASGLPGGDDLQRVSLAFGAFMAVQAVLYLPLGRASDHFGRKPVIVGGLLVFALGSLLASWAPDIYWLIFARCVQGSGAISAAVMALAADLTREQHRTKVMAMIGSTIGLVFSLSLVLAPVLFSWVGMRGMFDLIAALAALAIPLLLWGVPTPAEPAAKPAPVPLRAVLSDPQLLRLNFGIFALHVLQTALFLIVPGQLVKQFELPVASHWHLYLPVVLGSFVFAVPAIMQAERGGRGRVVFLGSIAILLISQLGLLVTTGLTALVGMLVLFFAAFNFLEASLPALVSRVAQPRAKGTALGVFNTTQALGVSAGSVAGGWIAVHFHASGVHVMTILLCVLWGVLAWSMQFPARLAVRTVSLQHAKDIDALSVLIARLPGVREVALEREQRIATLKINLDRWDEKNLRGLLGGEA